jgi:hypothetical protein
VYKRKERNRENIKKKYRRYKNEKKKNDQTTRKQQYIHMTRELVTVLFSHSQYRVIQKCLAPERQEKIISK